MSVLIVSVHPDDETLGCGGTILKYKSIGFKVSIIYITSGNSFQKAVCDQVNTEFDFDNIDFLNLPEMELDNISFNKIIPLIAKVFNRIQPEVVLLPNRSDSHSDHRRAFLAVQTCLKSFRFPYIKKAMMYEVVSETDFAPATIENIFIPNVFVDTTDYFDKKIEIYKLYKSEILKDNFARSLSCIEAHNRYRGSMINCNYAESFMLLKEIM